MKLIKGLMLITGFCVFITGILFLSVIVPQSFVYIDFQYLEGGLFLLGCLSFINILVGIVLQIIYKFYKKDQQKFKKALNFALFFGVLLFWLTVFSYQKMTKLYYDAQVHDVEFKWIPPAPLD